MARYLIDVNLPYYFSLWRGPDYVHVRDNLRMREFHERISGIWDSVCDLSTRYRLVHVFRDRIERID